MKVTKRKLGVEVLNQKSSSFDPWLNSTELCRSRQVMTSKTERTTGPYCFAMK